ncbi:MAG: hypothetical protein AB9869_13195 [Verrucomicrobiia bacterium]
MKNLDAYRSESPLFEFTLPEDNLFQYFGMDAPGGTTAQAVDVGIYLLVTPLSVGTHTVHLTGIFPDDIGWFDNIFNITVVPQKQ